MGENPHSEGTNGLRRNEREVLFVPIPQMSRKCVVEEQVIAVDEPCADRTRNGAYVGRTSAEGRNETASNGRYGVVTMTTSTIRLYGSCAIPRFTAPSSLRMRQLRPSVGVTKRITRSQGRRNTARLANMDIIDVDRGQVIRQFPRHFRGDVVYEIKPTAAMEPPGDSRHRCADREGTDRLITTIDEGCAHRDVVACYEELLSSIPRTEKKKSSLVGDGLFVKDDVEANSIIIEYTGNRITGRNLRRMNASFDHHAINPDVQVAMPAERSVIDPRGVGNIAMQVNHHCRPNAKLQQMKVMDRWIVCIVALRNIKAGEEVLINYNYGRQDEFIADENEEEEGMEEMEGYEDHEYDMGLGAKREARRPIIICACDAADCCLTI